MHLFQLNKDWEAPLEMFGEDPELVLRDILRREGCLCSYDSFIRYNIPKKGMLFVDKENGVDLLKEPNPGFLLSLLQKGEYIDLNEVKEIESEKGIEFLMGVLIPSRSSFRADPTDHQVFQELNDDGVFVDSSSLDSFLCEQLGFDETPNLSKARLFFLEQYRAVSKGGNRSSLINGENFFKFICYQIGLTDKDGWYTYKGDVLLRIANKLTIPFTESVTPTYGLDLLTNHFKEPERLMGLLFKDSVIPNISDLDKRKVLAAVYSLLSITNSNPTNLDMSGFLENSIGEFTLYKYWLEHILGIIETDENGNNPSVSLNYEYECDELFKAID